MWERALGSSVLNAPALADLTGDAIPEIIISDIEGCVSAIHSDSGKVLWRRKVSDKGLTAPLPGVFAPDGAMDVVVGDFDGRLYLLSGGTGFVRAQTAIGKLSSLPLTLVPMPSPSSAEGGAPDGSPRDASLRDLVVAVCEPGQVTAVGFSSDPLAGSIVWTNSDAGQVTLPPVAARLFDGQFALLVVGTTKPVIFVIETVNSPGKSVSVDPREGGPFRTKGNRLVRFPLVVGDLDGDGQDDIVYADENYYVMAVGSQAVGSQAVGSQAVGSQAVGSQAVGSQAVGSQAVGSQAVGLQGKAPAATRLGFKWADSRPFSSLRALAMADFVPGPGLEVLTSQNEGFYILGKDGRTQSNFADIPQQIESDLTIIDRAYAGGPTYAVYADKDNGINFHQIDAATEATTQGQLADAALSVKTKIASATRFALPFRPGAVLLAADPDYDGLADVFGTGKRGKQSVVFRFTTDIRFARQARPWAGPCAQPFRSNCLCDEYYERVEAQQAAIHDQTEKMLAEARQKYDIKDWTSAMAACDAVLARNPERPEALSLRRRIYVASNFWPLALAFLAGVAGLATVSFYAFRFFQRRGLMQYAALLKRGERFDDAIQVYRRLRRYWPGDRLIQIQLAELLARQSVCDEKAIPVLEFASRDQPSNAAFRSALAHAYVAHKRLDAGALAVCESARQDYHPRDELDAFLGRAYAARGREDQAIEHFESAVKHGCQDPEVIEQLVRLCVKTRHYRASSAPVFERVAKTHPNDPDILEGACMTFIASRRVDDEAISVYERLLEQRPNHVPVLLQLSAVALSVGNYERARELAQRIVGEEDNHADGLSLLAQSLVGLGRLDTEAIDVLERATQANPGEKDLLRALAHAYIDLGRKDAAAVEVFRRARREYPDDVELNRAVAEAAERGAIGGTPQASRSLLTKSLEKLLELGQEKKEVLLSLAAAYKEEQVVEPKAQRPYEQARDAFPGDMEYRRLLGIIYQRAGRLDGQVIATLEPLIRPVYEAPAPPAPSAGPVAPAPGAAPGAFSPQALLDLAKHLARAYQAMDRNEDALKLLQTLGPFTREDGELRRLYAEASLKSDRLEGAIEEFRRILEGDPNDAKALADCAVALNQLQRMDAEALGIYRRALAANPKHPGVIRVIGRVHAAQGNLAESLKALSQVIKLDPKTRGDVIKDCQEIAQQHGASPDLHWFLAQQLAAAGRFNEAIDELQAIYQINPDAIGAIIKGYEQILARDPQNAKAQLGAGALYRARGETKPARAALEKAYALLPGNADVQAELAALYGAILRDGDDVEVRFKLGEICQRAGRYDEAIGCFQRCAQDYRYAEAATRMLGQTFMSKGMLDIAFHELKKIPPEGETKELLYDLSVRFQEKGDAEGAKNAYRVLMAADINYRDVKEKYDLLTTGGAGAAPDANLLEKTAILSGLNEAARRRYDLENEIGRGAMGIVYRAYDNELEETTALKILPDNLSNNPDVLARFKAEARSARRLSHPNIVRIHDIGEEMGRKYISMEYVKGVDVKSRLRNQGFSLSEAVRVAERVADALAYAHEMGIVHRDVKPANIMIAEDGTVKVTDFGIAKVMEANDATQAGAVLGTPLYMAPEQILGETIDPRVDVYALGVMTYEMITGRPPFTGGDLTYQHLHTPPPPLKDIPDDVAAIVMKCLAKKRDDRYPDARQLRDDLSATLKRLQALR